MAMQGAQTRSTRSGDAPAATATGLRVMMFDPYPHGYGGSQRVMHRQACTLLARGAAVCVVLPGRGAFFDELVAAGIPTRLVPAPPALTIFGRQTTGVKAVRAAAALPRYWLRLARVMRSWRPTIVHINDHRGAVLATVAARLSGARVIWHVHSLQPGAALTTAARMAAHGVVVPSRAVVDRMPALALGHKVQVLANPAPDLGTPTDVPAQPHLVTAARLHPDKGLDVLLEALAKLRASAVPEADLVILGGVQTGWETYPADLARQISDLGLGDAVTFAGQVDDVGPRLRGAAVYVQASRPRTEVMPLAILEAMAAGRPIVATAVGAVPEMLEDGVSGLLVPPEDPGALADALAKVLASPAMGAGLGEAAWKRSRGEFGEEAFGATLLEIYGKAARRG